jgi:ABC-2 type transport system ATP-binding protein
MTVASRLHDSSIINPVTENSALIVRNLRKVFAITGGASLTAVDGISFDIRRGECFGLLGPNGAGKSTSMNCITGFYPATSGEIRILDGLKPGPDAARQIGYLPEERGLYPKMRVIDMVVFIGELRGLSHHESKLRAGKWLERLGLAAWTKNKVQDLSKGMAQKVQFATALIHEPALLILDEPWSGLDPINAEVLREVVEEIRGQGRTVLFSTHGMEQAEKICDQVCIIARGKKVLDGRLKDIKRESAAEGVSALGFADQASQEKAKGPLEDKRLVIDRRPPYGQDRLSIDVRGGMFVDPHIKVTPVDTATRRP